MLAKRYESTKVDRRTSLHVPSGTLCSISSDTQRVDAIQKILLPRCIYYYSNLILFTISRSYAHFGYRTIVSDPKPNKVI